MNVSAICEGDIMTWKYLVTTTKYKGQANGIDMARKLAIKHGTKQAHGEIYRLVNGTPVTYVGDVMYDESYMEGYPDKPHGAWIFNDELTNSWTPVNPKTGKLIKY